MMEPSSRLTCAELLDHPYLHTFRKSFEPELLVGLSEIIYVLWIKCLILIRLCVLANKDRIATLEWLVIIDTPISCGTRGSLVRRVCHLSFLEEGGGGCTSLRASMGSSDCCFLVNTL